jgi:hypothetical protein
VTPVAPSPTPSPTPRPSVTPQPVRSVAPVPQQKTKPQPERPPTKSSGVKSTEKVPTAPTTAPPTVPPIPATSGDPLTLPNIGSTQTSNSGDKQAFFGGLDLIPCTKDCLLRDRRLIQSPTELVPVPLPKFSSLLPSQLQVKVTAMFDRDKGTFVPGLPVLVEADGLTAAQLDDLRWVVSQFVEKCQFEFVAKDRSANPPPVEVKMQMAIKIS